MRGRLFLKVYLTVIGGIAILALAGLVAAMLLAGGRGEGPWSENGWDGKRDAVLAALLPAEMGPEEVQAVLDNFGEATGAEMIVWGPEGSVLAAYASEPPTEVAKKGELLPLPGGRSLTLRLDGPFEHKPGGPLVFLALAAALTALAAWPVVRHLTGRLERLRKGVEFWGEGDLARRVPVEGGDEIAAVASSFNRAAARVEALVASNRALLANASHELRSPLARLRMAVDLYERNPGEALRAEILRNLSELDELVGEILLSSRLTHAEGSGVPEPGRPVDLLALAAEEAARSGLEASGEPAEVMGDSRLLARLLRNLIQNALRHGTPPVEILLRRREGFAELSVRDHGAGLSDPEGERLFEPFYRPGGFGEAAGGWGLGLALVRQIAERHGGRVRHETPADGGTRFVATLPLAPEDPGEKT